MNGKTRVLTIINPSHFAIPLSSLNHGPSFWSNIFNCMWCICGGLHGDVVCVFVAAFCRDCSCCPPDKYFGCGCALWSFPLVTESSWARSSGSPRSLPCPPSTGTITPETCAGARLRATLVASFKEVLLVSWLCPSRGPSACNRLDPAARFGCQRYRQSLLSVVFWCRRTVLMWHEPRPRTSCHRL